jgi:transposase InsO family protein
MKILFQVEIVLELVSDVRRRMPRCGGRKLYSLLQPDFERLEYSLGRNKFFDVLRDQNLLVKPKKRYVPKTTESGHLNAVYPNLVKDRVVCRPKEVLVSDITYLRIERGFSYLFLITDLFSRLIVGYDVSESLSLEGAIISLQMAAIFMKSSKGTIHHSDRGVQYSSHEYVKLLFQAKMKISMTAKGSPHENAHAERVNGILKGEFLLDATFGSHKSAKVAVTEAIHTYNDFRPHYSLGLLTPTQFYKEHMRAA